MIYAVIDTNVLVSAQISKQPHSATVKKDRPFYEVSLSMDDSFLVTGNLKHFPATPKVISPAEMVAIIEQVYYETIC